MRIAYFFRGDESVYKLKHKVGLASRYYGEVTGKKFKVLLMRKDNGVREWRIK